MTHTPGPWRAKTDPLVPERGAVYVEGPEGWRRQSVCDCQYAEEGVERDEANARLIAAAPEMLEAAKLALFAIDEIITSHKGQAEHAQLKAAFEALDAAIAKAEGKS